MRIEYRKLILIVKGDLWYYVDDLSAKKETEKKRTWL
jgi:hypothetical protein